MASFAIQRDTGEDWKCVVINSSGQYRIQSTGVFEAFAAANFSAYIYAGVEDVEQGYIYTFTLGTLPDDVYTFRLHNSAAPLVGDDPYSEFSCPVVSDSIIDPASTAAIQAALTAQGLYPARSANLDNLDVATSTRSSHTAEQAGAEAASKILKTPANLLATDASGQVEASNTDAVITANTSIAAIKSKTDTIGGLSITWSSNVDLNGTMILIQNDDYPAGYGIVCTATGYSGPSLTGGTSKLYIQPKGEYAIGGYSADLEITGTVSQDGTTVTCTFIMTAAQTNTLSGSVSGTVTHYYKCVGITSTGSYRKTLSAGDAEVLRNIPSAT